MPGPVTVTPRVLRAMSKPMINHRSAEFAGIYTDCREILSSVFQTKNDIFVLSGSGTAGMEAAVGSLVGSGDKVIAIENGKFGERFKDIAAIYGEVVPAVFEWGHPVDLEVVKEKLEEGAKAITLVHNETSAGILNPAAEIGKLAKKHGNKDLYGRNPGLCYRERNSAFSVFRFWNSHGNERSDHYRLLIPRYVQRVKSVYAAQNFIFFGRFPFPGRHTQRVQRGDTECSFQNIITEQVFQIGCDRPAAKPHRKRHRLRRARAAYRLRHFLDRRKAKASVPCRKLHAGEEKPEHRSFYRDFFYLSAQRRADGADGVL